MASANGQVTFYTATQLGNCMFTSKIPGVIDVAANLEDYDEARACGTFLELTGPKGKVVARVADSCPTCDGRGHFDVEGEVNFVTHFGPAMRGRIPVSYRSIPFEAGPLQVRVKEGSSQYWAAVLVQGHRLPVTRVEMELEGGWGDLQRQTYNYWVSPKAPGRGLRSVRVTLVGGETSTLEVNPERPGEVFQ
jgi:expansin (peptidoglycan-binding protein)